jgi:hypothetical protein
MSMPVVILALLMPPPLTAGAQNDRAAHIALARATIERLAKGDLAAVEATFSEKLRAALPEAKLREAWQRLQAKGGRVVSIGEPQIKDRRALHGVVLPMQLEKRKVKIEVVFNGAGEIVGLLFN